MTTRTLSSGRCSRSSAAADERLERRHVAGAAEHDVRLAAPVVARPLPDADAARAMGDRVVHRQEVERGLLAGDDHVDVVAAAQAVVGDREQAVRVRRQVDADDLRLLVDDVVDEPRVLMGEAVVVLPPHVGGQEVVQRGDRPPPRDVARDLEPLRVLVEHRVDDVDERLVAREEAVAAGEQVALEPALAEMLAEHLHHPAVGRQVVVAVRDRRVPGPVRRLEQRPEAVRGGLVGSEDAEVVRVARHHVAQEGPEHPRRLAARRAPAARRRPRSRGSRASAAAAAARRRWRGGSRPSAARPRAPAPAAPRSARRTSSKSSSGR